MAGGMGASLARIAHAKSRSGGRVVSADGRFQCVSTGQIVDVSPFSDLELSERSPAALVLALAERGALDRLRDVNGQFAAACYDGREHRLTLLTDRLGTFPMHVWSGDGEVVFGTHTYVMLGHPRIRAAADPETIAQLFALQRTIGRSAPIAGIRSLPAATIAEFDGDGKRERQYWQLRWRAPGFAEKEGGALVADALRIAVARHACGARNALLLSGGLDSRLVLAAAERGRLACWTVGSFEGNPELETARSIARVLGAEHHSLIVAPNEMLPLVDRTTIESDGFYPASTQMSCFVGAVAREADLLITGHGLDYTLRSMYLPARSLIIGGSKTRLPLLPRLPEKVCGADIRRMLRQGLPATTVERILLPQRRRALLDSIDKTLETMLRPFLDSSEPLNAWDAYVVENVSKHYTFTGMMSVRAQADMAIPGLDNAVVDLYLQMPPKWRLGTRIVRDAMTRLSPDAARIPNANTGYRSDLPIWSELSRVVGRGALRRLRLVRRPALPSAAHTAGSWPSLDGLYAHDPIHRARFQQIRGRLDALSLGVLSPDALAQCIDEHLEGRAKHGKLMRQLLTHDAWVRNFAIQSQ
jgi:asparagine synthase (glutamine-hydrolysing)